MSRWGWSSGGWVPESWGSGGGWYPNQPAKHPPPRPKAKGGKASWSSAVPAGGTTGKQSDTAWTHFQPGKAKSPAVSKPGVPGHGVSSSKKRANVATSANNWKRGVEFRLEKALALAGGWRTFDVDAFIATDINWHSVTYGNGTFVAVSRSGNGNHVMTWVP